MIELLGLTNELLMEVVNGKTVLSQLQYDLAWVRTVLKNKGLLTKSGKGNWEIVHQPFVINKTDLGKITKHAEREVEEEVAESENWKQAVIKILVEKLSPSAFERLIQRILREKGFSQVEITGRIGDGGVDGKGIAKINDILSFHIIF